MPEAALSVGSSLLAAVQPGANMDVMVPPALLAKGPDPFATLLASATGTKGAAVQKTGSADTLGTLLATAAPVVAVPIGHDPAPLRPDLFPAPAEPLSADADTAPAKADPAPIGADPALVTVDPSVALPTPASVADGPPPATPTTTGFAPTVTKAVPSAPIAPVAITIRVATDTASVEPRATVTEPKHKRSDKGDTPASKDDRDDPLGDAIASGATAVLAFAPAIVMPPVQHDSSPQHATQVPLRIGGLAVTKPVKLPPVAGVLPHATGETETDVETTAVVTGLQADPVTARNQPGSDATQAEGDAPRPPAPAAKAEPATIQLPSDIAKAVTAALKQGDIVPATPVAAGPTDPAATPTEITRVKTPAQPQAQPSSVPGPARQELPTLPRVREARHDEEAPAPRRVSDARKRVDPAMPDAGPIGSAPPSADPVRTSTLHGMGEVHGKGDAIVQQTLSIARDGAWLDRLARDIANAGNGGDLHFKLEPQNLGALSVAISQGSDGSSIRLTADNETTRDILVDAQPKLIAEARAQGLKVSDTQVDLRQDQKQGQNQNPDQDTQRWAQNGSGQNGSSQNGQNRQSSPGHQPFVSNLGRKAESDSESRDRDSDALYA